MKDGHYSDLFNVDIAEVDPDTDLIIRFEEERQARRFILIPSESIAPRAVRQALGSVFNNIYAEGYPPLRMTRDEEELVLEHAHQLAYYRRYSDRRFYKGVEYADFIETLAQRRCAQCFATKEVPAEHIFVNVQPLSGAAANLAVYQAFLRPGDTLMGMNLFQGGHLTHGSEFNLSGRLYNVISYNVDRHTERLNYDTILSLAREHRPKIIVAGYTSYPWAPDWAKFRAIADEVGALLMADIAHTAGMAVAGAYPNPIGYADIITFTTHKTICGPRGAVIMTTDEEKAQRIDAAIFPGEQGGPHVNKFAAMAVAFKIAQTEKFRRLQYAIVENAKAFADSLAKRGLKLAYGGTDTHLLVVDLRGIKTKTGFPLRGEIAARILDLCGIVVNKNTIPGDELTALGSGIRMGTPWVTQRGMQPEHLDELAEIIARVLTNIQPFKYIGLLGELPRGKVDLDILETARRDVDALAIRLSSETKPQGLGYPHFMVVPETPALKHSIGLPVLDSRVATQSNALLLDTSDTGILRISGWRAKPFLQQVSTGNIAFLGPYQAQRTFLLNKEGVLLDDVAVLRLETDERGRDVYLMLTNPQNTSRVKSWLRGLSDGYILFDEEDIFRKVEGPAVIEDLGEDVLRDPGDRLVSLAVVGPGGPELLQKLGMPPLSEGAIWHGQVAGIPVFIARLGYGVGDVRLEMLVHPDQATRLWAALIEAGATPRGDELRRSLRARADLPEYANERPTALELYQGAQKSWFCLTKPYFVGQASLKPALSSLRERAAKKQEFVWREPENAPLKRTPLYNEHRKRTTKLIPFAGWEMPVWYSSVSEEHQAVRSAAGLFDVAHMGVLEVSGEHAASFLDVVASNYARWIDPGQSAYAYFLDPDGNVIDDFMMYRLGWDRYLLIVNAANAEKDLAWLRAVNSREVIIDRDNPAMEIEGEVTIRDLKDPSSGDDQRVDLALQGPNSLPILQSLTDDIIVKRQLARIRRTDHMRVELAGFDLIVARTGYTGEEWGFELLVHPDRTVELWNLLLEKGAPFGLKPCGLAARDSTRIEAGLPLYGHELAGEYGISPSEAGFAPYVKFHKPFFIGRKHCLEIELNKKMEVVRFRVNETGVRALRAGDPVVNKRGQYIGRITSCTLVGGRQIGMAYVEKRYNEPGTEIGVFPLAHGEEGPAKPIKDLASGDKVPLPVLATVVRRFPDAQEKATWGQRIE
ncbi:MAG: glycine cleavage system aminomethyltransferase GcvT [Anaerolineae bacterium]